MSIKLGWATLGSARLGFARKGVIPGWGRADGPINTVAPLVEIEFPYEIGALCTCTTGTWTTLGTISGYTYQWYRGSSPIVGETTNNYQLTADDDDLAITCRVTATDEFGSRGRTSNSVGPYDLVPDPIISDAILDGSNNAITDGSNNFIFS